ncbi:MAG: hypothetical protein A2275_06095 [Bacteroidetes bacterium RIFOXYA12_FULL_35_11]|nr:MAG: hypothetical protein A2X01_01660 [Bacteroidetes bacterium GWF2_35_48]OFY74189.1 MAG: hypothetical protein A2275_06095 [Bacteroidetes bacterium RIFOXYA12_FULL_35_11]OFY93796.1 MAG: hypothetical protein A2491_02660 [Bacteroidetes bacterium RIFOXYC12_FULL_35_7]OFY96743.1 MAG: hypothetical protein A2309_00930 [Bacteroidetes bacterium RIFOXYB2_FULL_35_7]HBX52378.1 restriction endonuclease subunit S [Bacteroidales bacterium]
MTKEQNIKLGYKKSPLGNIPIDWNIKSVGEAFDICNNLRFPISEEERNKIQGEYPYYGPTKIQDYINEYRVDGKYTLIGEDGDHFLKWKDLPMTLLVEGKFNVNNHAHILKGNENLTEWFFYFFNQRELTPFLTRQGAGRYKLTKDALSKMPCILPPLTEQKLITSLLSTWDKAINNCQLLIINCQLKKKWLMQNLLTGKKRLLRDELGIISDEWKTIKLGDVFKFIKTYSISREGLTKLNNNNSVYCIHYGDIHAFYENDFLDFSTQQRIPQLIDESQLIDEKDYLKEGDIIMADASEDYEGVGEVVEVVNLENKIAVGGLHTIVLRGNSEIITNRFCGYFFSSEAVRNALRKVATGTSVYSVTKTQIHNLSFIIPNSLKEQTAIAKVLQAADKEIQLLKTKTEKLKEQKKGLMQQLLTGKKRLTVMSDEL